MILLICVILKYGTNELIYETKIKSQCRKQTYGYQGKYRDKLGYWDCYIHIILYKTDN